MDDLDAKHVKLRLVSEKEYWDAFYDRWERRVFNKERQIPWLVKALKERGLLDRFKVSDAKERARILIKVLEELEKPWREELERRSEESR